MHGVFFNFLHGVAVKESLKADLDDFFEKLLF